MLEKTTGEPSQRAASTFAVARNLVWKECLADLLSVLGRLARLASYRDSVTGVYAINGRAFPFSREISAVALRRWHEQVFAEWLGLTMEHQGADLQLFLLSESEPGENDTKWLLLETYELLPPASALEAERGLFLLNLSMLLSLQHGISRIDGHRNVDPRAAMVLRLVAEAERQSPTLEVLARELGMSTERLRHLFKIWTGSSFRGFLRRRRIERVAQDLRATRLPIKQIAETHGYDDLANFGRDFRAVLSLSPREYRDYWHSLIPPSVTGPYLERQAAKQAITTTNGR